MGPLPPGAPEVDRLVTLRVPPDPCLRLDSCDDSLDPRLERPNPAKLRKRRGVRETEVGPLKSRRECRHSR